MRKIGILGGAFDPIHKGHILIGQQAYAHYNLDEIWVLPNGKPPHKCMTGEGEYLKHRINMIQSAIADIDYFKLNTFEIDSTEDTCYSYATMKSFNDLYEDCKFYFLIGKDSLMSLDRWYHPEILLQYTEVIAFNRDDTPLVKLQSKADILMQEFGGNITVLQENVLEISSTQLRKMIKENVDLSIYLDKQVVEYIRSNNLYI